MSDLLEVAGLDCGYGQSQVLFGLGLRVPRTGAVAILGRNGAGKTTLLKTLIGELRASAGTIHFDADDVAAADTEARVRRGLGYVPQEHAVFARLSVRENLLLGTLTQRPHAGIDMALDFFPKLAQRLGQQAGTLSGGERKMLAISRALLGQPKLLMLDEPTEGVWIGVIEEIGERLRLLSREMAVLIVEQHIELALTLADHAYVIDRGTVALEGPSDAVRADPQLIRYLAP